MTVTFRHTKAVENMLAQQSLIIIKEGLVLCVGVGKHQAY